jgi:hypothetical protein
MRYATIIIFAWSLMLAIPARADCPLTPNGTTILAPETRPAGTVIYNIDYGVFQGCDGTDWRLLNIDEAGGSSGFFLGFTDLIGQGISSLITSNVIQVNLSDSVSISGDGLPEYRVCSDSACNSEVQAWGSADGTINQGDFLQLRLTSNASWDATNSATITIGGNSDQWDVTAGGCQNVGEQCAGGTYYIGQVGGNDIYATSPASEVARTWNNGTTSWTTTGFTSWVDGSGNTAGLVALADAGAPYNAADYCDGLSAHGYDDWYLPAQDELSLFYNGGFPVAGVQVGTSVWYWSSSEWTTNNQYAFVRRFNSSASNSIQDKDGSYLVRCVRR